MDRLLTIPDVAAQLAVSIRTVRRLIADRQIDAVRVARRWRIESGAVARYTARQTQSADVDRSQRAAAPPVTVPRRHRLCAGYASMSAKDQRAYRQSRGL